MKTHLCCHGSARADARGRRHASWRKRAGELAGWVIPSATLALLPKCPLCVAGYVALATGIGISFTTAAYLRTALIVLCVLSLVFIAARRVLRFQARRASQ